MENGCSKLTTEILDLPSFLECREHLEMAVMRRPTAVIFTGGELNRSEDGDGVI